MTDTPKCSDEGAPQRLKQRVLELTERCPIGPKNPEMCPLYPVRKRRSDFRANWIDSLKPEDLEFVASYHQVCSKWQNAGCP